MPFKIEYEIELEVKDKNGKVIKRHKQKGKSFLKNFSELMVTIFMKGDVGVVANYCDKDGVSRTTQTPHESLNPFNYAFSASYKVQCYIGTSNLLFNRNQFYLNNFLDKVTYSNWTDEDDGSFYWVKVTFAWSNATGSSKNIEELAYVIRVGRSGSIYEVLLTRDVIGTITVPDNGVLAIGYKFKMP